MDKLDLISFWVDYCRKLAALFAEDHGGKAAKSLQELFQMNVNAVAAVVPANGKPMGSAHVDKIQKAFESGEALVGIYSVSGTGEGNLRRRLRRVLLPQCGGRKERQGSRNASRRAAADRSTGRMN